MWFWSYVSRFSRERIVKSVVALAAIIAVAVGLTYTIAGLRPATPARSARATATLDSTQTPTPDPWITEGLSVKGTRIVDAQGQPVTLLGAARFSLEYRCQGDGHFKFSDFQAMRAWGMNTVRIPLSSAYWRNLGNQCPTYHATVMTAVATAEAAGMYVILDLQRDAPFSLPQDAKHGGAQCPLPDATSDLAFWRDVARIYRDDPRVLFDLFGEPHDISWSQWWNGGWITSACFAYQRAYTYKALGMPALASAVRAIAPRNIIILSGLGWGYDLSGLDQHHAVSLGGILYGTHPWDHATVQQPSDWTRAFGATARQLPVIATEFGAYNCQTGYIATEIAYFERLGMSFLAWAWTTGACKTPGLIVNWSGAPVIPYGQFIQREMLLADKKNPASVR